MAMLPCHREQETSKDCGEACAVLHPSGECFVNRVQQSGQDQGEKDGQQEWLDDAKTQVNDDAKNGEE